MRVVTPLALVVVAACVFGREADGRGKPHDLDSARATAWERYHEGDYDGFVAVMEDIAARSRWEVDQYNLACGYALDGQAEAAIATLGHVVDDGFGDYLRDDSDLDSLRGRPEFDHLMERAVVYERTDERLDPWRERAFAAYHAGRYDRFVAIMEEVLSHSDDERDLYNLACGYALDGRTEAALTALSLLAERSTDFDPAEDSDFAGIQADPRFRALASRFSG